MKLNAPINRFAAPTAALALGMLAGWLGGVNWAGKTVERMVAFEWRKLISNTVPYGAHVFLVPLEEGLSVRAKVHVDGSGPFMEYVHDCGELGRVATANEAVERWGRIEWKGDGLHIGSGTNHLFLERSLLEKHR